MTVLLVFFSALSLHADTYVSGGLKNDDVRLFIKKHFREMRYCYEHALSKNQNLSGKLIVKWNVAKDGSVQDAAVKKSYLNDSEMEDCCIGRLKTWTFPKSPKETSIVYPFVFRP